jgi:hypothetical protein
MKPLYSEKERCRNGSFRVAWGKDSPILTALFLLHWEATHPGRDLPHRLADAKSSALGADSCSSLDECEGETPSRQPARCRRYSLRCIRSRGNHQTTLYEEQRKENDCRTGAS